MKIAILGYGTVGSGVYDIITNGKTAELKNIEVKSVFARSRDKMHLATDDYNEIIEDNEISVVVECLGGINPAYEFIKKALENNNIKENKKITGLTTAAGIWGAAGIGLAIGVGFYQGAILTAISIWGIISMFQPLKIYLQKRSKIIELYIVVNSTEAYNRVLVYCAEKHIRVTDSRTAFGEVNQSRIQYFDVPEKKIASFITLELPGKFEHLRLMEELSDIVGVIYLEETS